MEVGKFNRLFVSLLALMLVAGLAAALGYAADRQEKYNTELDNIYKKSYLEAMDSLSDIELKLSKLSYSEGISTQKNLLSEVWMGSEIVENDLSQLANRDGSIESIVKFLNQLGDYCHYLSKKISTTPLSDAEKAKLENLYKIVESLRASFRSSDESLMNNAVLVGRVGEGIQLLGDSYEHFNNDSDIDYPEMIYDGPFSDGVSVRNAQYLKGLPEISETDAEIKMGEIFKDLHNLHYLGINEGSIRSYVYQTWTDAGEGTANISVNGGKLVQFTSSRDIVGKNLEMAECKAKAEGLITAMGYTDMEMVWVTEEDSSVYFNYAYKKDGVIYYPDYIKLKIACDTGTVLAFDASGYVYNHIQRTIAAPSATITAARANVSPKLTITAENTALIPTEWNTELLAYEFVCNREDDIFYVYIDANTLEEIKIMKVVDGKIA